MPEPSDPENRSAMENVPFAGFVLERRLAVGGMSEIFLARRRDDVGGAAGGKPLVLKRLLPDLVEDDTVRDTFELEAKLHRGVRHANIVEFIEFGTYAGEPYIAMEYVDGVDLGRILRRAKNEARPLDAAMCVHVARRLCNALNAIHAMKDDKGASLGVVHRDVTPSNILATKTGEIKLGDFGIAHVSRSVSARTSLALRGKYAYLAPEQVAGDHFDHRADLFSLAVVLAEMLIGGALFPGAGQLAVLLAIRDARLDALNEARSRLPKGLYEVLAKALAKEPEERFGSAREFSEALARFEPNAAAAQSQLVGWVAYTADHASTARQLHGQIRESLGLAGPPEPSQKTTLRGPDFPPRPETPPAQLKPSTTRVKRTASMEGMPSALVAGSDELPAPPSSNDLEPPFEADDRGTDPDGPMSPRPASSKRQGPEEKLSCALRRKGSAPRSVHLAKLIELIATGQIEVQDEVDFGDGFRPLQEIAMLARYMPRVTQTTRKLQGPGTPDFLGNLPDSSVAEALSWIVRHVETGVLFAEPSNGDSSRSELYFERGKLVLTVSNEPAMLLGERLVSKGLIDRAELEMAVLVMHRYNGQLGDTIIGLGLADPIEVFQALRAQGRERVAGLFKWRAGKLAFYRGIEPAKVDFRLDLDIPGLLLAGLAEARAPDQVTEDWQARMDDKLVSVLPKPQWAKHVTWPSVVLSVLRELEFASRPRDVVKALGPSASRGRMAFAKSQVLQAIEACELLGLVKRE